MAKAKPASNEGRNLKPRKRTSIGGNTRKTASMNKSKRRALGSGAR